MKIDKSQEQSAKRIQPILNKIRHDIVFSFDHDVWVVGEIGLSKDEKVISAVVQMGNGSDHISTQTFKNPEELSQFIHELQQAGIEAFGVDCLNIVK